MKLTHDQRVLLKREAELIRQAYENEFSDESGDRAILKQRYDEIDEMLRGDCTNTSQVLN